MFAFSFSEAIVEADSDREKKLLNSRLAQLEANLKLKDESEQEMKLKLLDTVAAVERVKTLNYFFINKQFYSLYFSLS